MPAACCEAGPEFEYFRRRDGFDAADTNERRSVRGNLSVTAGGKGIRARNYDGQAFMGTEWHLQQFSEFVNAQLAVAKNFV